MDWKNTLKIRTSINSLSVNRINRKLVYSLIGVLILQWLTMLFALSGDAISLIKETLSPLQNLSGNEHLTTIIGIVSGIIFGVFFMLSLYALIYATLIFLLNWFLKKILSLFHRDVSLFKLLNISIYSLFYYNLLKLVLIALFIALQSLLSSLGEKQLYFAMSIPIDLIYLFGLIIYLYGVAISIKKQEIDN